jgi:pyruvate/2-oxoglutarate dehydrogenase complex dihydrolipoamide dehydrogenase (E3) component
MSEVGSHFLPKDDAECVAYLQDSMLKDDVQMLFQTKPEMFEKLDNGRTKVTLNIKNDETVMQEFDAVLLAVGRVPNVSGLGLEAAGINFNADLGIKVDEHCLTTNENVYAIGDCVPGPKFTHNSDMQARTVVDNAFFFKGVDVRTIPVPYCTFTDPQVAAVGKQEAQLQAESVEYDKFELNLNHSDRALCDSEKGLYKILCAKGTDKILGATLVGGPAGDLISQITAAMHNDVGLSAMGASVYPYPSYADVLKNLADAYNRTKIGPAEKSLIPGMKEFKS